MPLQVVTVPMSPEWQRLVEATAVQRQEYLDTLEPPMRDAYLALESALDRETDNAIFGA